MQLVAKAGDIYSIEDVEYVVRMVKAENSDKKSVLSLE